jgi:hypothetical protein
LVNVVTTSSRSRSPHETSTVAIPPLIRFVRGNNMDYPKKACYVILHNRLVKILFKFLFKKADAELLKEYIGNRIFLSQESFSSTI